MGIAILFFFCGLANFYQKITFNEIFFLPGPGFYISILEILVNQLRYETENQSLHYLFQELCKIKVYLNKI